MDLSRVKRKALSMTPQLLDLLPKTYHSPNTSLKGYRSLIFAAYIPSFFTPAIVT